MMIPSAIEREVLIEAPVQTVWGVVTEPAQLASWFADVAEIDLRPGGEGMLTFDDRATSQRVTIRLRVETVEPPHTFAFRWDYPEGAVPDGGNSLRVEFTLTAEGDHTRLRVTESGFPQLQRPDEEKTTYVDTHSKGWDTHLASLADYVAGQD
jgi:uncharacterized protein YndB with AHSA1/START domain